MGTKTQPARGMRDFLPADVRRREYVIGVIKEVYERYGFEPLETPAVENIETLLGRYGEEGNQLIFKILRRGVHESSGEADLALRYDLTVPLARVVAEYRDKLPKFFKRYQIQPVWRADRPARGRFREFYQCDVDILGSRSMVVEAEICAAASDALTKLGFTDFRIRLNHRKVLQSLLDANEIPAELHTEVLVTLDKVEKVGLEKVAFEWRGRNVSGRAIEGLLNFFAQVGVGSAWDTDICRHNANVLAGLDQEIGGTPGGQEALSQLRQIQTLSSASSAGRHVCIDPSLARGLAYYSGAIIEIIVSDLAGSLGGGGRYDNLVGMFLGQDVPACGFSLGLERIIVVMTEREMFPPQLVSSPADVMVSIWNEASIADSIALAQELRGAGLHLRVDLYPEVDKLGKQFKYASARGIPFVAVIGEDERARGEVAIKDMRSGEQRSVKREATAQAIRGGLDAPG